MEVMPLFDEEVPAEYANYHLKIRSPILSERRRYDKTFDLFLERAMKTCGEYKGCFVTRDYKVVREMDVAFVKLGLTTSALRTRLDSNIAIQHLCEAILNVDNGHLIKSFLTDRMILGISAVHPDFDGPWRQAVFMTTCKRGPEYLRRLDELQESVSYVPDWSLVLSFVLIAGVNIGGYAVSARVARGINAMSGSELQRKLITMFGPAGVGAGSSFLERLTLKGSGGGELKPPDLARLTSNYESEMINLTEAIEGVLAKVNELKKWHPSARELDGLYGNITDYCYRVTVTAAKTMVANTDVFRKYVELRRDATSHLVQEGLGAAAFFANAAFAIGCVAVPTAEMTAYQAAAVYLGLAKAPMTLGLTNPVTFWFSLGALCWTGYNMIKEAQKRSEFDKKMARQKNVAIFISHAWTITDETALFLRWVYCVEGTRPLAGGVLERGGNEKAVTKWREFEERATKKAEQRAREREQKRVREKQRAKGKKALSKTEVKKTQKAKEKEAKKAKELKELKKTNEEKPRGTKREGLTSRQERLLRYIHEFAMQQGGELENTLERLKNPDADEPQGTEPTDSQDRSTTEPQSSDTESSFGGWS